MKLLALFTLLMPLAVIAQANGDIRGHVRDKETGEGVFYAAVYVVRDDTSIPSVVAAAYSDENGYYELRNIPPGTYTLCFRYIEMKELCREKIAIIPGQSLFQNVEMERQPPELLEH